MPIETSAFGPGVFLSTSGRLPSRQGRLFLGTTGNMQFRKCAAVLQKPASVPAIILVALTTASGMIAQAIPGASPDSTAALSRGEWPVYAGTYAAARGRSSPRPEGRNLTDPSPWPNLAAHKSPEILSLSFLWIVSAAVAACQFQTGENRHEPTATRASCPRCSLRRFLALPPAGYGQPQAEAPSTMSVSGANRWGEGDERGNGNTQGFDTRLRCAAQLAHPRARVYELGRVVSDTMPQNPFGDAPVALEYLATRGIPFTRHAGNGEVFSGGIGSQGTQFDALGHFGFLDAPWSGTEPFPAEQVRYYNGFTQAQVKPSADAPLQKLGVDKAVPIVTSAVMLDAVAYRGRRLDAGELVTAADIEACCTRRACSGAAFWPATRSSCTPAGARSGRDPAENPLVHRVLLAGPGPGGRCAGVPGGAHRGAGGARQSVHRSGADPAPPDTLPDLPFSVHHNNLTQHGIHQIQNLVLDELARDGVSLSCAIVLPLRVLGGAGSMVRPIAVGTPRR